MDQRNGALLVSVSLVAGLALAAAGCTEKTDTDEDLRDRIAAAGIYSPARTDVGRERIVELGRMLFFDRELSGNRNVACASCHLPFAHAADGLPLGRGQGATGAGYARDGGPELPRNTPSPFNRSFAERLLWDGRVERLADGQIRAPVALPEGIGSLLEAQALLPLLDRDEMRGQAGDLDVRGDENELAAFPDDAPEAIWEAIMARLMTIDEYRSLFHAAFPGSSSEDYTIAHAAKALAQFQMHLWELTDTRFDVFLGSEHRAPLDRALTERELQGAALFFGDAGCVRCHSGPLLGDDGFHNIGVPPFGLGRLDRMDEGRFVVTGDPADRFAFRTPPLRNVELTAPYMHNGTSPSLEDAIAQHLNPEAALDTGFVGSDGVHVNVDPSQAAAIRETIDPDTRPWRSLDGDEIDALLAFLRSLSSQTELDVFEGAGAPMVVPSGLPVDGSF